MYHSSFFKRVLSFGRANVLPPIMRHDSRRAHLAPRETTVIEEKVARREINKNYNVLTYTGLQFFVILLSIPEINPPVLIALSSSVRPARYKFANRVISDFTISILGISSGRNIHRVVR